MNKTQLIAKVAADTGHSKADTATIVDATIDAMFTTLVGGEEVALAGFGKFSPKPRDAREARNPKTGETVDVAATVVARFHVAKQLKDALAETAVKAKKPVRKVAGKLAAAPAKPTVVASKPAAKATATAKPAASAKPAKTPSAAAAPAPRRVGRK